MKKLFLLGFAIVNIISLCAQKISRVTLSTMGQTEMITINSADNAVINLSPTGQIINYGTEYFSERVQNYSRVEPYTGRIELYTDRDDKAFVGKLRYLGGLAITYFASYEDESLRGKVKKVGTINITYYMPFDNQAENGKIKSIGNNAVLYYSSFDNKDLQGKLKSFGGTSISFYNSFDDKAFSGKIKSIGANSFTYYPSFDRQAPGAMKAGSNMQNLIGGINYIIR